MSEIFFDSVRRNFPKNQNELTARLKTIERQILSAGVQIVGGLRLEIFNDFIAGAKVSLKTQAALKNFE